MDDIRGITDEREERERVSRGNYVRRYRVVSRGAMRVSWLGGPSGAEQYPWRPAGGAGQRMRQHVNVRRQAKHRPGPGQGGVWSPVVRRDSAPTGTARRARRSHRAPRARAIVLAEHECTSHGATACIVHVPIDGDIRYGYVVSYDATPTARTRPSTAQSYTHPHEPTPRTRVDQRRETQDRTVTGQHVSESYARSPRSIIRNPPTFKKPSGRRRAKRWWMLLRIRRMSRRERH